MGKVNKIIVNNRMLLRTIWLHNRPNALWQQRLKNTILAKEKNTPPSTSQNTKALSSSLSNPETTKSAGLYNNGVIQKYQ